MGTCECKSAPNGCNDTSPQCTPQCPAGYEKCSGADCTGDVKDVECSHNCASCNNEYNVKARCKKIVTNTCGDGTKAGSEACDPPNTPCTTALGKSSTCSSTCTCPEPANVCGDGTKGGSEACDPPGSACTASNGQASTCTSTCTCPPPVVANTCDAKGAKWVIKPALNIPYNSQPVEYEYITGDTDGVQNENIIVRLDGESIGGIKIPATGNPANITVRDYIGRHEGPLAPGSHRLEILWNDIKGAGGVPCYANVTFTIGPAPVNTCDALGAKWVKMPPSTVAFGKSIPFEYLTGDTDGVQNVNIITKLDGSPIQANKNPAETNAPNITVSGELNPMGTLTSGSHKLEIAWNDVKGAGGVPCYAYKVFTVSLYNPQWDIEKTVVQTCENDWTANPISNLSYNVTITNTDLLIKGGTGVITRIVDTLDPKVDPIKVSNISNGGVLENGKIVWTLTSPLSDFSSGQSKSFTYSVSVDKSAFGAYENNVVASTGGPEENSTIEASANIVASCNVPGEPGQPQTGLFDDSKNIVLMGGILLFVGLGWSWLTDSFSTLKHKMSYESKSRFEKRVSKR